MEPTISTTHPVTIEPPTTTEASPTTSQTTLLPNTIALTTDFPTALPATTTESKHSTQTSIPTTVPPTDSTDAETDTIESSTTDRASIVTMETTVQTESTTSTEAIITEATDVPEFDTTTDISGERSEQSNNAASDLGIIVGSVVAAVVGIILMSVVAVLILIVAFLLRIYKKITGDKETRNDGVPPSVSTLNGIEMNANLSYIPVFNQISMGDNIAYGDQISTKNVAYDEMVNQDSNGLYETIDPPIKESTTQLTSQAEQSERQEDITEYNYVNYYY